MNDELLRAAEDVIQHTFYDSSGIGMKAQAVAGAYLADHPADPRKPSAIRWYGPEVAKTWPDGSRVLVQRPSGVIDSTLLRVDWIDRYYSFCSLALIDTFEVPK